MAKKLLTILLSLPALFGQTSCLNESELKEPFRTLVPEPLADGWEISAPQDEGVEAEALETIFKDFHADREIWQVRSLLVIRNGKLTAESYTKDPTDRDRLHPVWSCTKQVLALLIQQAIEQQIMAETDTPISDYLPEVVRTHPEKAAITVDHLLTMTSGIDFSNSGFNGGSNQLLKQIPGRSVEFVLGLPMHSPPGTRFNYSDGDPQILSAILQTCTGCPVDEWAAQTLFAPLEIERYEWLRYRDGITMGAWGLSLRPRDFAKIGQLVADRGSWKNRRLISPQGIERLTEEKIPARKVDYHEKSFGYYWWVDPARQTIFMNGQGGQFVCVHPDKTLVVVVTAEPNTQGSHQFSVDAMFSLFDRIEHITH